MLLYLDYYNYKFGCERYNLSVMHGVTALGLSLPWIYTEGADLTLMRYYRYYKVTLITNLKINIVTKFQVSIFKSDEVRGGGHN